MNAPETIDLIHKNLNKFWVARLEGKILIVNSGINGGSSKQDTLTFKNSTDAKNKLANLFLDKVVEGYEDKIVHDSNPTKKVSRTKHLPRTEFSGLVKRQQQKGTIGGFAMPLELKGNAFNIEISSFCYNDFDPKQDDYERVEVRVEKSSCAYEIKELKGRRVLILIQAQVLFVISEAKQRERFVDKDWESEWILPTLHIRNQSEERFFAYTDERLFTLELN